MDEQGLKPTHPITWIAAEAAQRRYPARADDQARARDARGVCERCISGGCCSTEGPIALTAFDVLRLAAALDCSPAALLRDYTQDRFEGPDEARYTAWLRDGSNSVISFLRRRTLDSASPCIFLKYIHQADGTPRRVCSVHAARPLACREYYQDTCNGRWTGEMAVLEAVGYEALRDGRLDAATVEAQWRACAARAEGDSLAQDWQRAFWAEMRRALHAEAANHEGSFEPGLAALQDPLPDKINRLLSTPLLRFEEKYGPEPLGEQLHGFNAGLALASGAEAKRLRALVSEPRGPRPLHGADGLRLHLGHRELLGAATPPLQALLQLSQRCGDSVPLTHRERAAELHLALAVALQRWQHAGAGGSPGASSSRSSGGVARALARHAGWALALCRERLRDEDVALAAADGLAQLAQLGVAGASPALQAWRRSAAGQQQLGLLTTWRRAAARDPAAWLDAAPLALMQACEPAASARWLARLWAGAALQRCSAEQRLALAERCLRLGALASEVQRAVQAALEPAAAHMEPAFWDAPLAAVRDLWHDDYVLRAVRLAGLQALRPA